MKNIYEDVWTIIDNRTSSHGEIYTNATTAKTREEAITAGRRAWEALSAYDKKRCDEFFVCLAWYDEDGILDWESIEQEFYFKKSEKEK